MRPVRAVWSIAGDDDTAVVVDDRPHDPQAEATADPGAVVADEQRLLSSVDPDDMTDEPDDVTDPDAWPVHLSYVYDEC